MSDGIVILALIATVSLIGMSCLIIDMFHTEERIVIRPRIKSKPKPRPVAEEYDVLIDEDCFDA